MPHKYAVLTRGANEDERTAAAPMVYKHNVHGQCRHCLPTRQDLRADLAEQIALIERTSAVYVAIAEHKIVDKTASPTILSFRCN